MGQNIHNGAETNIQGSQTVNNGGQTIIKNHDGFVNNGNGQLKPCEGSGNDGSGAGAVAVVCCMSPDGPVGCDHASSGSGGSGASDGAGGSSGQSLKEFLTSKNLNSMQKPLSKLGVEKKSDFKYLNTHDIKKLGGTFIQQKKLEDVV